MLARKSEGEDQPQTTPMYDPIILQQVAKQNESWLVDWNEMSMFPRSRLILCEDLMIEYAKENRSRKQDEDSNSKSRKDHQVTLKIVQSTENLGLTAEESVWQDLLTRW